MASIRQIAAAYLAATLVLSSVSIAFEWASPIDTPEGPWGWYREIGMRNGMLVGGGHVAPGGGWILDVHWPRFVPFPFYSGAGPESGGLYLAFWFVVGCVAVTHSFVRAARRATTAS